jgi:lysozyme family protein
MAAFSFEATRAGYLNMWRSMVLRADRDSAISSAARRIIANRTRYRAVEMRTGVPWFLQGILHMRESSNNFAGVLHNGERIIGTGRLTKLVPAGRGPFETWEDSAVDALQLKGLHKIKEWTVERCGYEAERFNGFGYMSKRVNSPYLWAGSNHYTAGKYVRDGVYDSSHVDTQLGVMPVLKRIAELDITVRDALISGHIPVPLPPDIPAPKPPKLPKPPAPPSVYSKPVIGRVIAAIGVALAAIGLWFQEHAIALAVVAFMAIGAAIFYFLGRHKR